MILKTGDLHRIHHTITDAEIRAFAAVSGDHNPIHLDEGYAHQSPFGRRIAHGMYLGGLISGVLGTKLPGPGSIYLSQDFKFLRPAFVGETITILIRVTAIRADKPIVTIETLIQNSHGETILIGEAVAKVPAAVLGSGPSRC